MDIPANLSSLGLSPYAVKAYLALLGTDKAINGSQLSVRANIPRARIYDVLRTLKSKGIAVELESGLYAPLPPEELVKRLRHRFDTEIEAFEQMIQAEEMETHYDYVWTISDYEEIMAKAREMIAGAKSEVYIRVTPQEGLPLEEELIRAEARGAVIKFIVLGIMPQRFKLQVEHHDADMVFDSFGGRAIDIIVDKEQILAGVLGQGGINQSPINWTKNRSFVISGRENLRHDYFHIFLHKVQDLGQPLSEREKKIYEIIKTDY
ncbi:MAG: TrmB family transcriptional regulator [Deltaproteobacteria bacterium]|nr:TrmB family transcriptional regulator [Deltaproteobacteria bacterium]